MRKYKLILAMLGLSASMMAHASFKQNVKVCLNVENNVLTQSFRIHFLSSDGSDDGTVTSAVQNGLNCAEHTYKAGPKKITLHLFVYGAAELRDLNIINLAGNCKFKPVPEDSTVLYVESKTQAMNEQWNVSLKKQPQKEGYKYSYSLACQHSSYN